jgi:hypothetical protein
VEGVVGGGIEDGPARPNGAGEGVAVAICGGGVRGSVVWFRRTLMEGDERID